MATPFRTSTSGRCFGLTANQAGELYVSSEIAGQLLRVNTTTKRPTRLVPYQEGGAYSTFVDSFGNVWFSDRKGVIQYNPATRKRQFYAMPQTTVVYHKGSFTEDADKNLWIFGLETGLFRYDRQTDRVRCVLGMNCPRPDVNTAAVPAARGLLRPAGDALDSGRAGRVVAVQFPIRQPETLRFYPTGRAFAFARIPMRTGNPSSGSGPKRAFTGSGPTPKRFNHFVDVPAGFRFIVQHMYRSTRTGIVWFCTTEGLIRYNPHDQAIQTNRLPEASVPGRVQTVNAFLTDRTDPSGQTVWMAVSFGGLLRWNRRGQHHAAVSVSGPGGRCPRSGLARAGQAKSNLGGWQPVGTSGRTAKIDEHDKNTEGVYRFDPKAERFLDTPFSVHHTFFSVPFYSLGLLDRRGRFWLVNHYESVSCAGTRPPGANYHFGINPATTR